MMLQPRHVALHPMIDVLGAMITVQNYLLSKILEVNFITITASIEAEKQNDRAMHGGGKQDRTGREGGRRT